MPAEQQHHIEAEFLDDSWNQMRALLDQEMPQNSKPQPPGKSWLTAILLLLFAWTTYLYWPQSDAVNDSKEFPKEETKPDTNVEPIAAIQPTLDVKEGSKEFVEKVYSENVKSNTENSKPIELIRNVELATVNNFTVQKDNKLLRESTNQAELSSFLRAEQDNKEPHVALPLTEFHDPSYISNKKEALTGKSLRLDLIAEHISGKNFEQIEHSTPAPKVKLISTEDKGPKWSIGVNVEAIFDRRLFSGKYLGWQVKRKLSNQFSILAGIGYSEYQKLNPAENSFEAFRDVISQDLNSGADVDALGAGMPVRYDYDDDRVSIIGVNSTSYVTVPLELVFEVRKKWSVIAGLGFSYMVDASFTKGHDNETWRSHEDGTIVNSEKELLGKALQRFDISPSIGFTFRPTARMGFDLKFRNGLLDISKDKFLGFSEFHSNKYLHLGMYYDLFRF